ncbi:hypothetical protein ElP_68430 [Tautonia plasticadhaerens]|uniref:CN hydrolase domain-containing protein n=1 Tax=Tautonia plasticadhaerens TaxID=2527974 RepID=A0A518HDF2_9BACT|nr:hypothetical protein ElP_68430 [Tautonia plasticadhaerens]
MTSLPTTLLLATVLLPPASQESPAGGGVEVVEKTVGPGGMTVAIANVPISHDPGRNGRDLLSHARRAKQLGANLLLTPEFGLSGGFCDDCWEHIAESDARDDALFAELKALLDDRFRYILVNGPRRVGGDDGPRFLNSTYLICEDFDPDDPAADEALIYDKTFPPAGREQVYTRSGMRDVLTFDTPGVASACSPAGTWGSPRWPRSWRCGTGSTPSSCSPPGEGAPNAPTAP